MAMKTTLRQFSVGLGVGLCLALCGWIWLRGGTSLDSGAGVGPDRVPEAEIAREASPPVSPDPRAPTSEVEPAGVAFARNFWGSRWAEVEADLRERGKLAAWDRPPSVPWVKAAREFGERLFPLKEDERKEIVAGNLLQWHGTADAEWLKTTLGWHEEVSEDRLAAVTELVERRNAAIAPLAKDWVDRLDFEIRAAWSAGRYEYGPFSLPKGRPGAYFWTSAQGHEGWVARISLTMDDCPGLAAMTREIRQLVGARNADARLLLQ